MRSRLLVQEASAEHLPLGVPVASPLGVTDAVIEVLFFEGCPHYQPLRINGVDIDPNLSDREEYGLSHLQNGGRPPRPDMLRSAS
jgi:hypothetical protein